MTDPKLGEAELSEGVETVFDVIPDLTREILEGLLKKSLLETERLIGVLDRIEAAVMSPSDEAPPPQTRDELAEYVERELEAKADFWASFQLVSRENRRLRMALEFYAEDYEPDRGYTAKAALATPESIEQSGPDTSDDPPTGATTAAGQDDWGAPPDPAVKPEPVEGEG